MKIDNSYLRAQTALLKYEEESVPKLQNLSDFKKAVEQDVILSITRENNLSASVSLESFNDAIAAMNQVASAVTSNPQAASSVHINISADTVANLI